MSDAPPGPGYIKLSRKFFQNALWLENRELSRAEAFLDLIQSAAYTPVERVVDGMLVTLQPGQVCASLRYLSARWNWSIKRTRNWLDMVERAGMIGREKGTASTVITLTKWEQYNSTDPEKGTARAQQGHTEGTARAHKGHKVKKVRKEEVPPNPQGGDVKILPDGWKQLSAKDRRTTRCLANSPLMLRIGKWFRRGSSTLWTVEEAVQLRQIIGGNSIEAIMPEIEVLEDFYTEEIPEESDFRRRNLITLLNNWVGELDRAREHIAKRHA